jgi:hypothetical protein
VLSLDHACREATGEERPEAAVPGVERLRVGSEQALKASRKLGAGGLQD